MTRQGWTVVAAVVIVVVVSGGIYVAQRYTLEYIRAEARRLLPAAPDGDVDLIAAIALAEGYGEPLSVPRRANNPIDLKVAGWKGLTAGAEKLPVFSTLEEGYARAANQIRLVHGGSHVYTLTESIAQMAASYTDTAGEAWAANVTAALQQLGYNVTTDSPLSVVLA